MARRPQRRARDAHPRGAARRTRRRRGNRTRPYYRFDRYHLGLVLWVEASDEPDPLPRIRHLVSGVGQALGLAASPLVVPADENSAWAWLPTNASLARTSELALAPIAMLCADLVSARAWIYETLGDLAIGSTRNDGLRETARVFLQTGGSYTATAEHLFLHRNTTSTGSARPKRPSVAGRPAGRRTGPTRVPLAEGGRAPTEPLTRARNRASGRDVRSVALHARVGPVATPSRNDRTSRRL